MELYKFLQQQGLGSRRACRQWVEFGRVSMNGKIIREAESPIDPDVDVDATWLVNGQPWHPVKLPLYLIMHKPEGYETSHNPTHHPSVFSLLPAQFVQIGILAVGRLDADTSGLLIMSTDGKFVHALTAPRRHVAKCYRVGLKHPADEALLERLRSGVLLKDDDQPVRVDSVEFHDLNTLRLTISEGRYHQVKRMIAAAGNRVAALHREMMGGLLLDGLEAGQWRALTEEELRSLGF
jgi:16S rRNA pseudouridine516 synthase